jgi:hypothetical protein
VLAEVSDRQIDEAAYLGRYMLAVRIDCIDGVIVLQKVPQDRDETSCFDIGGHQEYRAHDQCLQKQEDVRRRP